MSETSNTVHVSFEKVLNFRHQADQYLKFHPGQHRPFTYALSKMLTRTKAIEDDFNDRDRELNLEYCHKDSKGFAEMEKFTVERRGEKTEQERMKFTTDKQKELNKKKRGLLNEEVAVEPYLSKDVPEDIGFDMWSTFAPFVLPNEPSEEQLTQLYEATTKRLDEQKAKNK